MVYLTHALHRVCGPRPALDEVLGRVAGEDLADLVAGHRFVVARDAGVHAAHAHAEGDAGRAGQSLGSPAASHVGVRVGVGARRSLALEVGRPETYFQKSVLAIHNPKSQSQIPGVRYLIASDSCL